jgi:hypothetical protein
MIGALLLLLSVPLKKRGGERSQDLSMADPEMRGHGFEEKR